MTTPQPTPGVYGPDQSGSGQGWQPIATAPKDGTEFVALHRWAKHSRLRADICSWDVDAGMFCFGTDGCYVEGLLHWMPLPAPPEVSA